MQNSQANPRRRKSNLGKRLSLLHDSKSQQSQPIQFNLPITNGLRRMRSAKKTPSQLNKASHELTKRKRLFQLKSPTDFWATGTPTQDSSSYNTFASGSSSTSSAHISRDSSLDITGVCSFSRGPSPDFHTNTGSSLRPSNSKSRTTYQYDPSEPPKSPVLSHNFTFSKNCLADLKPPVDPDDLITFKVPSYRSERAVNNCAIDLKGLNISAGESKRITPIANKVSAHNEERDQTRSDCQLNIVPLLEVSTEIPSAVNSQEGHVFKKPESILQLLRSSEKLSVVNEVESESADDSFILAEQTINGDATIVGNSNLTKLDEVTLSDYKMLNFTNDGVKTCDSSISNLTNYELKNIDSNLSNSVLKDLYCFDSDDDIDCVLTHIKNLAERSEEMKNQEILMQEGLEEMKKQQIRMQKGLEEVKKQQVLMEAECSQLKQAVQRLKKKKKGKQQPSVENKENNSLESSKKINDAWMKKMKQENPNLLKTPNVRRNRKQSNIWTPHSLSNKLNDQMDDIFD